MTSVIKIILSILLFGCLMDMPYGYFQLVRFLGLVGFSFLAYHSLEKNQILFVSYVCLAVLFQPFVKISLGRELWNIVDVLVGAFLIASLFISPDKSKNKI
jgi:hypothetical protein